MDRKEIKRQQKEADGMNKEFAVKFLKRDLILINNILLSKDFKVADAILILPVLEKIRPFIQDTFTPPVQPKPNNVDIGRPKN